MQSSCSFGLEFGGVYVEGRLFYDIIPAEPRTWDSPGWPSECHVYDCHVTRAVGETWEWFKSQRGDWFEVLNKMVLKYIEENQEWADDYAHDVEIDMSEKYDYDYD